MDGGNVENVVAEEAVNTETNAGGVPKGAKTSDYYRVNNIPGRFDNPDWFQGYSEKPVSALYRTTNSNYGCKKPTVHTMPTTFHAKSQKFSECLGKCGMYRNHSLNCDMDKKIVPDH